MKDWMIRAIKTFIQAFFGVLIPALCAALNNGWPEDWNKAWLLLAPTVAAALASAISAVWNIILEELDNAPVVNAAPEKKEQPEWKPPDLNYHPDDE